LKFKEFFCSAHKTHTGILLLLAFLIPAGFYFLETITIAALFVNWVFRIERIHIDVQFILFDRRFTFETAEHSCIYFF